MAVTDRDETGVADSLQQRRRLRRRISRLRGRIDRRGAAMVGQLRPLVWLWDRWFSRSRRKKETHSPEKE